MKPLDIMGKRFGHLVVKRRATPEEKKARYQYDDGKIFWVAKCDCGKSTVLPGSRMKDGSVTSCGCYSGRTKDLGESAKKSFYTWYKAHAKRRGKEFSLSFEEFIGVVSKACHYCGAEGKAGFSRLVKKDGRGKYHGVFMHNGIDRIDSALGYIPGNCVPCCKHCNYAKNSMTVEEFKLWILRVYNHVFREK